jgi:palmitoyltransferase
LNQFEIDLQFNIFLFLTIMVELCYTLASFTDPRQPEVEKYLTMGTKEITPIEIIRYTNCEICGLKKHERTSHCRSCDKCVLRRDHHCIWIGNCVGYANNQYFVNFLIWVLVRDANNHLGRYKYVLL